MRHKLSLSTILAICLILFGVGTLVYPIIANHIAERDRGKAIETYDKSIHTLTQEMKNTQVKNIQAYNQAVYDYQQGNMPKESIVYGSLLTDNSVMGTIEIPSLDIKSLPFYHGTEYATLNKGLGHFEPTTIPIGGKNTRSIITGHSGLQNQVLFSNIEQLQKGDIFYIHILGETLAYEIKSFEEVLPSEIESIEIIPNEDIVTLLTCTPPGINTYRLLIDGYRIPNEQANQTVIKKRGLWSYQNIVISSLIFSLMLIIVLYTLKRLFKRQSTSDDELTQQKGEQRLRALNRIIHYIFIIVFVVMIIVLAITIYGYSQTQIESH